MIEVSGKQIVSNKISIKECFAEDMWFSIPDYQRPYVWGEEQICLLLDDIYYAATNTPDTQYFLGSLVLHCESRNDGAATFLENSVLDGQQRLTTLYILHAVVRDISDSKERQAACAKAIHQAGYADDGIPERLRIEFAIREEVEAFINEFIKPQSATTQSEKLTEIAKDEKMPLSVRNMAKAIAIMHEWFSSNAGAVDTLFPFLRQYVILIYVASGELEDAFRLFTVLNDRGIKLRNSDIFKAQNLKHVEDSKKQTLYARFWEEAESELGEDFDLFLSYIRTILIKEKARHNLLKEFEDGVYHPKVFNKVSKAYETKEPVLKRGVETFEMIKGYKQHYDAIFSGNNYEISKNWAFDNLVSILQDTALSDIWIAPLLMYRRYFGNTRILDFLVRLDNKFSADWIGRASPTSRIESMNSILKEIERASSQHPQKDQAIESILSSDVFQFGLIALMEQIDKEDIYGKRYARYLLRKIDFLLDAPLYSERRNTYSEMSIEHVLPQNPEEDSQWLKDFSAPLHSGWCNRLGNLVLISRRKNSQQGRLDFKLKKEKYFLRNIETFPNSLKIMQEVYWNPELLEKHHEFLINLLAHHYAIHLKEPNL